MRRNDKAEPARPSIEAPDVYRHDQAVLFSQYISTRPLTRPTDSTGEVTPVSLMSVRGALGSEHRNRLLRAFEDTAPAITGIAFALNGRPTVEGADRMATTVIDRLEGDWADMRFRWRRYPRQRPFNQLGEHLLELSHDDEVLDMAGAWLDAFARLPGGMPWMKEAEERYATALDEILRGTIYARRGRDIILREDTGSEVVIEGPLWRFMLDRPDLKDLMTSSARRKGNSTRAIAVIPSPTPARRCNSC
jgi:hypothetical protein